MVFSSIGFLAVFLPALILLYYVLPRRFREGRNLILLGFSLLFYGYGGAGWLLLMLGSILIDYLGGLFCGPRFSPKVRRLSCLLSTALALGLLGWFKYAGFFAETANRLGLAIPIPQVVLPVGISFFTFQGLSYVYDVYRGEAEVQKNPLRVALYVSLFPQLVAGPIVRYRTVAGEIARREESLAEFSAGAVRFCFGLGKKMLLANAAGALADAAFSENTTQFSVLLAWLGALAYTFQIYFDFSAYSDMAIGLGGMFGFHFPENFDYPYTARSVTEFWRRWHISLSAWFRDYVYIPLGGNRRGRARHIRNMAVVWLLTGLWHGAAWNFVAWGVWFCLLLLGEKYLWCRLLARCPAVLRHGCTMLAVVLSWVLFRAPSLSAALAYGKAMFGVGVSELVTGKTVYYLREYGPELLLCAVAALPVKNALRRALEKRGPAAGALLTWGPRLLALALLAVSYIRLVSGSFNPFIYFQF